MAVVGVVSAVANPAGMMDAQTLAVFSLISCSSSKGRYVAGKSAMLLSPFSVGPEPEGFVIFNLLAITAILGVFGLTMGYRLLVKHDTLDHAMHVARFPALFLRFGMMFYQGTAILSMRLVFDGVFSAVSVAGTIFALGFPVLIYKVCVCRAADALFVIPRRLQFYTYDDKLRFGVDGEGKWMRLLRLAFVPQGRWDPGTLRRRFAGPLSSVLPTWRVYAVVPLVQAFVVCFVASVPFGGRAGCIGQFASLFGLFVSFAFGVILSRPLRTLADNVLQAASYLILSVVIACTGFMAVEPGEHPAALSVIVVALCVQSIIISLRFAANLAVSIAERLWWKPRLKKQL